MSQLLRTVIDWPLWGGFATAIAGTFVGAYAAFQLERRDRKNEERKRHAVEGNLALVTLQEMFDIQRQFQREAIERVPPAKGRWLSMPVTLPLPRDRLRFDPAKLHFLLEGQDKNMLPELLLVARQYEYVADMVERRTRLMLEVVYPRLSAAGVPQRAKIEEPDVLRILGAATCSEAETLTEAIVKCINENVPALKDTFRKLRNELLQLIPGEKFAVVNFDVEEAPECKAEFGQTLEQRLTSQGRANSERRQSDDKVPGGPQ